jgi:hypothetical protein
MQERLDDDAPSPIPRSWLPEPSPPEGGARWEAGVQRVLAAAEPVLGRLRAPAFEIEAAWTAMLAAWWKPAALLAAAAAALLLVLDPPHAPAATDSGALPLSVIAADGEPAAMWAGLGIEADPVLALIALREQAP